MPPFELIIKTMELCKVTGEFGEDEFVPAICMSIDDWCKKHKADSRNTAALISRFINEVNDELGPY